MADYYSILKKTISGMANNTAGTRTVVYDKARSAIDRQLRAMDPVPSEEVIARQLSLLDVAISKIDGEIGAAQAATTVSEPVAPPAPAPVAPEPAPVPDTAPAPEPATTPALAPEPAPPSDPVAPAPTSSLEPDIIVEPSAPLSVGAPQVENSAPSEDYVPAGNNKGQQVPNDRSAPSVDPKGMDYSDTILAVEPDTSGLAPTSAKKSGVFSTLLTLLATLGIIGGGLYALWLNKDALMTGLFGEEKPAVMAPAANPVTPKPASNETDNSDQSDNRQVDDGQVDSGEVDSEQAGNDNVRVVGEQAEKDANQLTSSGQTIEAQPVVPTEPVTTPVAPVAPIEAPAPVANNEGGDQQVTEIQDASENAPAPTETTPAVATNDQPASTPPDTTPVTPPPAVAQKAFLYEEGTGSTEASRDNAAVIWSLGSENVDGNGVEAVIKGQLDVPGRELTMNLVIKRNIDASLPASHIIELLFKLPSDFAGGNIANVSRFVMKSSEQARGEGLVAVPAKISDGNFLIALNNLKQALATNRKLLLESSWIDVPLGYTTGKRALVTLEKGALGNKVFRDAFADWDKR